MSTLRDIAKNMLFLFISRIISIGFGFLYIMLMARYLGVEKFGIISSAIALTAILGLLSDLGLGNLITREVARNKKIVNEFFINSILLKSIFIIISFIIIILIIVLLKYEQVTCIVVLFIAGSVFINNLTTIINSIFQAYEMIEYISIGNALNAIFMFISILFLIYQKSNVVQFAFVYLLVSSIIFIYSSIFYLTKIDKPKIKININVCKSILHQTIPFALTTFSTGLFTYIGIVLISILIGNIAVGWYNASFTLVQTLSFIPSVILTILLPIYSRYYVSSKNSLIEIYEKSLKYMFIIVLPIGLGVTLLSDRFIVMVYGQQYVDSIIILRILIWWFVLGGINWLLGTVLQASNKPMIFAMCTIICSIVNLVLNVILIILIGYIGASIVTIVTEIVLFIILYHYTNKYVGRISLTNITIRPIIAGILMVIVIYLLGSGNTLLIILIAAITYIFGLLLFGAISKKELIVLRSLIIKN
jgi:O-antigen/teichoic acid export membrane protein